MFEEVVYRDVSRRGMCKQGIGIPRKEIMMSGPLPIASKCVWAMQPRCSQAARLQVSCLLFMSLVCAEEYMHHANTVAGQPPPQQGLHLTACTWLHMHITHVCWQPCIKVHGRAVLDL